MLTKRDIPVIAECIKFAALEAVSDSQRRALWRLYFTFNEEFKIEAKQKRAFDWKFYTILAIGILVAVSLLVALL